MNHRVYSCLIIINYCIIYLSYNCKPTVGHPCIYNLLIHISITSYWHPISIQHLCSIIVFALSLFLTTFSHCEKSEFHYPQYIYSFAYFYYTHKVVSLFLAHTSVSRDLLITVLGCWSLFCLFCFVLPYQIHLLFFKVSWVSFFCLFSLLVWLWVPPIIELGSFITACVLFLVPIFSVAFNCFLILVYSFSEYLKHYQGLKNQSYTKRCHHPSILTTQFSFSILATTHLLQVISLFRFFFVLPIIMLNCWECIWVCVCAFSLLHEW